MLQRLQRSVDVGYQGFRFVSGDVPELLAHFGGPELLQMLPYLLSNCLTPGHIAGNLIDHLDQMLLLVIHTNHQLGCPAEGRTSTAVTLYSGQLVAQSEASVVMTLVPLTG